MPSLALALPFGQYLLVCPVSLHSKQTMSLGNDITLCGPPVAPWLPTRPCSVGAPSSLPLVRQPPDPLVDVCSLEL